MSIELFIVFCFVSLLVMIEMCSIYSREKVDGMLVIVVIINLFAFLIEGLKKLLTFGKKDAK